MVKFTTNGWGMALLFFDSLKLANLRNPMAYVRFILCYNVKNCTDVELSERVNHLPFRQSAEVQNLTPNKEKNSKLKSNLKLTESCCRQRMHSKCGLILPAPLFVAPSKIVKFTTNGWGIVSSWKALLFLGLSSFDWLSSFLASLLSVPWTSRGEVFGLFGQLENPSVGTRFTSLCTPS